MAEQVIVSEYNPEWALEYEREKDKIAAALDDIRLSVEHIGSTSVPGLGAKPVIDMMVGVEHLDLIEQRHIDALNRIEYEYVPKPDFPERRFFRRGAWRAGTHHLHIYAYGGENWTSQLLFRDYLRSHEYALNEYYKLKKQLEIRFKHDRAGYTEAKASFIEHIISLAKKERNPGSPGGTEG
ncbi:GrpB family protein [Paenibacillus hamazuiensis]|uniref:GrpB family protein n=1 Tax=Paenibacillus hamazuiensis TaxID=2936508 RepID=UPI002010C16A|nr:GrpB family protein [Paenibacillus hamazuiensis]